jgi:uncharacterized membrane protein HdeD (DUF308 family)
MKFASLLSTTLLISGVVAFIAGLILQTQNPILSITTILCLLGGWSIDVITGDGKTN